jgi:hypothetical protein
MAIVSLLDDMKLVMDKRRADYSLFYGCYQPEHYKLFWGIIVFSISVSANDTACYLSGLRVAGGF